MRVKVSDPALLRDLISFLRECGCVAEQASSDELEAFLPAASNPRAARTEFDVYLEAWRIQHEGASAVIVG